MLTEVMELDVEEDEITKITRLGNKTPKEQQDPNRKYGPRPVKLTFPARVREDFFQRTYKLKNSPFSNISIRNDMTPLERETFNKIRNYGDELEKANESEKFLYRVRGHPGNRQIVKFEKA